MSDVPEHGAARTRVRVVAAVVMRNHEVLLTQRPEGATLGLLWEFPGGKVEEGETLEQALVRELDEELSVGASGFRVLDRAVHDAPPGPPVEVFFMACALDASTLTPSAAVRAVRWIDPRLVDPAELLPADRPFLATLAARVAAAEGESHGAA